MIPAWQVNNIRSIWTTSYFVNQWLFLTKMKYIRTNSHPSRSTSAVLFLTKLAVLLAVAKVALLVRNCCCSIVLLSKPPFLSRFLHRDDVKLCSQDCYTTEVSPSFRLVLANEVILHTKHDAAPGNTWLTLAKIMVAGKCWGEMLNGMLVWSSQYCVVNES